MKKIKVRTSNKEINKWASRNVKVRDGGKISQLFAKKLFGNQPEDRQCLYGDKCANTKSKTQRWSQVGEPVINQIKKVETRFIFMMAEFK